MSVIFPSSHPRAAGGPMPRRPCRIEDHVGNVAADSPPASASPDSQLGAEGPCLKQRVWAPGEAMQATRQILFPISSQSCGCTWCRARRRRALARNRAATEPPRQVPNRNSMRRQYCSSRRSVSEREGRCGYWRPGLSVVRSAQYAQSLFERPAESVSKMSALESLSRGSVKVTR